MKLFYKKANYFFMQFPEISLQKTAIKNSCESSWHLTTATLPLFIYFFSIFILYVDNLSQNIYLGKNHSSSQVQFQFHIPAWVDNCGFVTVVLYVNFMFGIQLQWLSYYFCWIFWKPYSTLESVFFIKFRK